MFLDVNNVRLNTVSFGSGNRTFLAHGGFVGSWELWQQPFELMSSRWRCVSYDHRGAGESPVAPEDITRDAMVGDVFAVMDRLQTGRCVIAGESMGGAIAIMAVLRQPDRFEGLVLVDSVIPMLEPLSEHRRMLIAAMRSDFRAAMDGFVHRCIPEPDSEHLLRWTLDICLRSEAELGVSLLSIFERRGDDNQTWPLSEIKIPTLVVHGSSDAIVPLESGKFLAESIPNAKLAVIDGAGHVPTMTRPHEVVEAIDAHFRP